MDRDASGAPLPKPMSSTVERVGYAYSSVDGFHQRSIVYALDLGTSPIMSHRPVFIPWFGREGLLCNRREGAKLKERSPS